VPVSNLASVKKKIRLGIVGCGQMGRWHLDACKLNNRVRLVAFADTELFKAQQFANEVDATAYNAHVQMINNENLDSAIICTLPSTHRGIAIDFLNAGVNVLCEKPLAISAVEAQEMVEKAKQKNLLLLTAFKFRFFDEITQTKELLKKGFLGKILNFRLMFGGYLDMSDTWFAKKELSGGGVIMDNASHAIDIIRYLFGEITSISAQAGNYQKIAVEDNAKLTLFMESGFFGTIDISWDLSIPSNTYLEIYAEDGTALLDLTGITYKLKTWNEWKRIDNRATIKEAFPRQIDHFVNSILSKKPIILTSEDGLKSQIVIDAAYESLKKNANKHSINEG
jgi:predicted dehydrogenase